jgi:glycosyltransferase involved in cell wall biosynthesis
MASSLDLATRIAPRENIADPRLMGKRLVIYFPSLAGGGAERLYLSLSPHFIRAGLQVTFLVDRLEGELVKKLPAGVMLDALGVARTLQAVPRLAFYLRRTRPDILRSALSVNSVAALWARRLAGFAGASATRVIVSEHNTVSEQMTINRNFRMIPMLYRRFLDWADDVIAVSQGVASDLSKCSGRPIDRIGIIYNGVVDEGFLGRSRSPCPHPWYGLPGVKIFVALGRLVEQKGFATLITAFSKLPKNPKTRLIILGNGILRENLLAQAAALGVADRFDLPGFIQNPLPYVAQANAFVLSSRYEGFGMALAEALACGTQVISTDCRYGPAEILENGRYGTLVPVDDADALAAAMRASLETGYLKEPLRQRGMMFTTRHCASEYLGAFAKVITAGAA